MMTADVLEKADVLKNHAQADFSSSGLTAKKIRNW